MYKKIVDLLSDGQFHSGDELGELLGVSRAAIWKQLQPLKDMGLQLCSVKGKGYRLLAPFEPLQADVIRSFISVPALELLAELDVVASVDSTNDCLMVHANEGIRSGTLLLAEHQTAGKGRRGRRWISPYGASLYLSLAWNFANGMAGLEGLSLAAGVAIAEAINAHVVKRVGLKWPNDLLLDEAKIGGILLEVAGDPVGDAVVVLGVGLNYQLAVAQMEAIDQPAAQLSELLTLGRNQLAGEVIAALLLMLRDFEREGFAAFVQRWDQLDLFKGKQVVLHLGDERVAGKALGVTATGGLQLATESGVEVYRGGEMSLRLGS